MSEQVESIQSIVAGTDGSATAERAVSRAGELARALGVTVHLASAYKRASDGRVAGAAAVLIDASVRDRSELEAMGLPIWTRWVRSRGAAKSEVGELDVPVSIGGQEIRPGDLVVLDVGARAGDERS